MSAFVSMVVYDLRQYIFQRFLEAIYGMKQSCVAYDAKFTNLPVKVERLESASAKKDAYVTAYEARVKGTEGEVFWE